MKKALFLFYLIFLGLTSRYCFSQERYHLINSHIVRETREDPGNPPPSSFDVIGYKPDNHFKGIWESLIRITNIPDLNHIIIRSADIQAIYSTRVNGQNIIFYDKNFFEQFRGVSYLDVDYLILFSFMHELGHFVHGDVMNNVRTRQSEHDADMYACDLLCDQNNASSEKIQGVIMSLDGATSSKFYYSKGERLKNIRDFFDAGLCAASPMIHFEFQSSVIRPSSYIALDSLSATMKSSPKEIKIIGYYYSGRPAFDLRLSKDMANSVKTYLVNSGVDAGRISVIGMGQSNPIASNSTEEGKYLNRRVEFKVY